MGREVRLPSISAIHAKWFGAVASMSENAGLTSASFRPGEGSRSETRRDQCTSGVRLAGASAPTRQRLLVIHRMASPHQGVALAGAYAHSALCRGAGFLHIEGAPDEAKANETAPTPLEPRAATLRTALARFFSSRGVPVDDVDDLVQDVFLRVVRQIEPAAIDNVEAYAFTAATSVLADRYRRRGARHANAHVTFLPERHGGEEVGPDRILEGRQALRATTRALLELPERTRRCFVLRRLEGLSFSEIAVRLGISVSSAEKDMQRAIRHVVARAGDLR